MKYKLKNTCLSNQNINSIFHAMAQAYVMGSKLNRFITVNLEEICSKDPTAILDIFLNNYRSFCTRKKIEPYYLWILEKQSIGLHAHIFLHIPSDEKSIYDFKKKVKSSWFGKVSHLNIEKPEGWVDFKSIKYGQGNAEEFYDKLQHLNKAILTHADKDPREVAIRLLQQWKTMSWGEHQFEAPLNFIAYCCKGRTPHAQGSFYGRRVGYSHKLA